MMKAREAHMSNSVLPFGESGKASWRGRPGDRGFKDGEGGNPLQVPTVFPCVVLYRFQSQLGRQAESEAGTITFI